MLRVASTSALVLLAATGGLVLAAEQLTEGEGLAVGGAPQRLSGWLEGNKVRQPSAQPSLEDVARSTNAQEAAPLPRKKAAPTAPVTTSPQTAPELIALRSPRPEGQILERAQAANDAEDSTAALELTLQRRDEPTESVPAADRSHLVVITRHRLTPSRPNSTAKGAQPFKSNAASKARRP